MYLTWYIPFENLWCSSKSVQVWYFCSLDYFHAFGWLLVASQILLVVEGWWCSQSGGLGGNDHNDGNNHVEMSKLLSLSS